MRFGAARSVPVIYEEQGEEEGDEKNGSEDDLFETM